MPQSLAASGSGKFLRQTWVINDNEISSVFDSFHGSGTALYEAMEISPDMHLVGCDINPLANLITKVKLQGVNSNIFVDIGHLINLINEPKLT